jgi:hypothetical protein
MRHLIGPVRKPGIGSQIGWGILALVLSFSLSADSQ